MGQPSAGWGWGSTGKGHPHRTFCWTAWKTTLRLFGDAGGDAAGERLRSTAASTAGYSGDSGAQRGNRKCSHADGGKPACGVVLTPTGIWTG